MATFTLITLNFNDCHMITFFRFNIQLMKTGRMKGQAFIGLPSEAVAAQALKETNGYQLRGKPIVVVYKISYKFSDNTMSLLCMY